MANIAFKKGLLANLPSTYAEGTFYVTTDERAIYLDVDSSTRIRLGDFQEFASLEALQANTNPSTTALYYISGLNILAKWNGTEYVQINKDTGATSFEVTGDGNAVTGVSYDATTRKLTLTKGATYMKESDVDSKISTAVGALGSDTDGNAYANVKAYVDDKTAGIASDAALTELSNKVAAAESEIDALQAANEEGGAVATAIASAQSAAEGAQATADEAKGIAESKATLDEVKALDYATKTEAQGYADAKDEAIAAAQSKADSAYELAEGKATMDEVNAAIAGAGHAVKSEVDQAIADLDAAYKLADTNLETKLQGNIDAKADQTVVDGIDGRVAAIEADYLKAEDKNELIAADESLDGRIEILEGQITGLTGAMHFKGVETEMPTDLTGYVDGDVIVVGEKEYVFNDGAFVEFGDVSAEGDRIATLEGIVGSAEGGLVKDVADNAAAIVAEKERAEAKEAELAQADATNLQAAKDHADAAIAALGIADYVKKADADAAYAAIDHNHDDKYDAIGAAAQALTDAQAYADQAELDAIAAAEEKVNALANGQVKTNTEAIATKAAQADLDAAVARIAQNETDIAALEEASATHALKTEVEAVQSALDEYESANDAAVALKANVADVYAKTETYTQEEVDAAIEAAILEANSWGSF